MQRMKGREERLPWKESRKRERQRDRDRERDGERERDQRNKC